MQSLLPHAADRQRIREGTAATGVAVLTGGAVTGVIVTNPGNRYLPEAQPTVSFSAPLTTGETATASQVQTGFFDTTAWIGTVAKENKDRLPYYQAYSTSNFYAGYFHSPGISAGGLAYAFAFDDQGNQSSTQASVNPVSINISLQPW